MTEHRIIVEADKPTAITVEAAAPGERCGTCGQPARFKVTVARMDLADPLAVAYCKADAGEGIDGLVAELALRKRQAGQVN
jgi:hypothetical protein